MRILISGGSGFFGWNLTKKASGSHQVVFSYFSHAVKLKGAVPVELDLRKRDRVFEIIKSFQPEAVIHTAALTDVDYCEENRELARDINENGTRNLAEAVEEGKGKLVFCSTDLVFDGNRGHYKETDQVNPLNFYAGTKVRAEEIVREVSSNYLIARVSIIYGWGSPFSRSFTDKLLERLQSGNEAVLFRDQIRSPIYTDNLSEALLEIAEGDIKGVLHLAGSERINRYDFGKRFAETFNLDTGLIMEGSLAKHDLTAKRPKDCSLDASKAEAALRTHFFDIDEGLNRMKDSGGHSLG